MTDHGGSQTAAPPWAKALPKPLPEHLLTQGYTTTKFVVLVYRESTHWWQRYREHDDRERAVEQARDLAEKGTPAVVLRQIVTHGTHAFVMSALPEAAVDG